MPAEKCKLVWGKNMQGQEKTKRELDIEEYRNFFRKELFSGESHSKSYLY